MGNTDGTHQWDMLERYTGEACCRGTLAGHSGGIHWWGTLVSHTGGTHRWDTLSDTLVGHTGGTRCSDTLLTPEGAPSPAPIPAPPDRRSALRPRGGAITPSSPRSFLFAFTSPRAHAPARRGQLSGLSRDGAAEGAGPAGRGGGEVRGQGRAGWGGGSSSLWGPGWLTARGEAACGRCQL